MLYEYTAANNGSDLKVWGQHPFITTGIVLLLSRFLPIGPLAIADCWPKYIPESG
jgi:K+-transporting ATPase A subunit